MGSTSAASVSRSSAPAGACAPYGSHQVVFIGLLIAFEATAGVLVLWPGRPRQVALTAVIACTVALVSFGWGFLVWSVPMTVALVLLLKAERRRSAAAARRRELVTGALHSRG